MRRRADLDGVESVWWGSDEPYGLAPTYEDDDYEEGAALVKGCLSLLAIFAVSWIVAAIVLIAVFERARS